MARKRPRKKKPVGHFCVTSKGIFASLPNSAAYVRGGGRNGPLAAKISREAAGRDHLGYRHRRKLSAGFAQPKAFPCEPTRRAFPLSPLNLPAMLASRISHQSPNTSHCSQLAPIQLPVEFRQTILIISLFLISSLPDSIRTPAEKA